MNLSTELDVGNRFLDRSCVKCVAYHRALRFPQVPIVLYSLEDGEFVVVRKTSEGELRRQVGITMVFVPQEVYSPSLCQHSFLSRGGSATDMYNTAIPLTKVEH